MVIDGLVSTHRKAILRVAERHGARNVRLFGSRSTGHADAGSDVDLLVGLDSGRSLLDLIAVRQDLQTLLGCDVDVVTERAISP